MPATRSYVDLATGAVTLVVGGVDADSAALVARARTNPAAAETKDAIIAFAWDRHRGLFAHEWAHVLQAAGYPYLFLRAQRQGRMMAGIGTYLAGHPDRYALPLAFRMDSDWAGSHMLATLPVRVTVEADRISTEAVETLGAGGRGVIAESDLLEEDAQIFQYRAEIGSRGTGAAYRRWLTEAPRYSLVFNLTARHLGDEPAYRLLPLFVRLAFRTTRPLMAFCAAFGHVYHNGADALADWGIRDTVTDLLVERLEEELGRVAASELTMARAEIDDPPGVLADDALAELLPRGSHLALWPLANEEVHGATPGLVTRFLERPWEFLPRRALPTADGYRLMPPGVLVRLADPGIPFGSTVLRLSSLLDQPFGPIPEVTYAAWFQQVLRAQSVTKAIQGGAAGPNPACPHVSCRVHATGLCHGWFPIPGRAEDCEFPTYLRSTTNHDVTADGAALVPVVNAPA